MPTASFNDIVSPPTGGGTASFDDVVSPPSSASSGNRASFSDIVSPPTPRGQVPGIAPPGAPPLPAGLKGPPDPRYRPLPEDLKKDFNPPRWIETGAKKVVEGIQTLKEPGKAYLSDIAAGPQVKRLKPSPHDPKPALTPELMRQGAGGVHQVVSGAFEAATPLMIASGAAAPVRTAITLGAATGAQTAVEKGLEYLGLPKEYAAVAGDLTAFIVGAKAHGLTDTKKAQIETTLKDRYEAKTMKPPPSTADPTRAASSFEAAGNAIDQWQRVPAKGETKPPVTETKPPQAETKGGITAPLPSKLGTEAGALIIPKEAVEAVGKAYNIGRDIVAPKSGVKPEKLDMVMGMQGDRARAEYGLDQTMAEVRDKFSDRNQVENIRYIDNLKEGKSQGDPYWDEVALGQRKIDSAMYAEVQKYKPDLPWKENHYRVIYERPPEWAKQDPATGDTIPLNGAPDRRGGIPNLGRSRPLRGTQGWAKKATLTNLSEGLGWEFESDPQQIQARATAAKLGPDDVILKTVNYPSHTEVHVTPTSGKGTAFVEAEEKLGTPLYKRGGKPISYNPQVLFETAVKDQMRYVTAQKLWEQTLKTGNRKFVANNDPAPDGMTKLDDRIADVYFKVPQGTVSPGKWYVDKEIGKLLNNFLSPDWLRDMQAADASGKAMLQGTTRAGKGLLWAKNNLTAIELAMSPFHFAFETGETIASQFGAGYTRLWNEGVRHGDMKQILGGLADLAEAPISPYTTSKLGGDMQAGIVAGLLPKVRPPAIGTFGGNVKRAFQGKSREITPQDIIRGSEYLRKNPEAQEAIGTLFRAGLKPEMAREYKIQSLGAMREALNNARAGIDPVKNYLGAAVRVLPAINQLAMKPLFEDYIPKLKMGQAMKEYSQQIRENAAEIAAGKITKDQIARNVVFRVEARFGEMNFDNLFWNNTMKSAMQILFRSATWRIGTVQGFGSAIAGQVAEFAEPLKAIADHANSTKPRPVADYIPKLSPMMGWAFGLITSRMIYSGIRQQLATGQPPQSLKDWMWPQTGGKDDRGKPLRENPPSYLNDAVKIWKNRTDYVTAGMTGFLKNVGEAWRNEDFFQNYVYDPEEPVFRKTMDSLTHIIGKPFFLSTWQRSSEMGADTQTKVMGALGVGRAPSDTDITDAEAEALSINHRTTRKKTPEEAKEQTEHYQIGRAMRAGDPAAVDKYNKLTRAQQRSIDRRGGETYLQGLLEHMTAEDALNVWEKATPAEKEQINDIIGKKLGNKLKKLNDEDQYEKLERRAVKDGLLVP